jgi:sphingomyelin phosphodiesterase acid-like 3
MRRGASILLAVAFVTLASATTPTPPARAADETGVFAVISDIHFDPFATPELASALISSPPGTWPATLVSAEDQPMSRPGQDTNHALLVSSLAAFTKVMAAADFAIVPGDLLTHDFHAKAETTFAHPVTPQAAESLAVSTTLFVADALAKALAGKPAIVALGNNDSGCGDYRIDPGGRYLAGTREVVRRLAGAERLAPDFDQTYAAGGYYALRHPTVANAMIVVLNDVLWSTHYRDACGSDGLAAAQAMWRWLNELLARQRAAGGSVWMVHHIPWGIDPYITLQTQASSCPAKVVPFLQEPFASEFPALLASYHDVLRAAILGHTHFDDYRLLIDQRGTALAAAKLVPAISPVFGQNPAFQVFSYDKVSGTPRDFSTWYLSNPGQSPAAADWQLEYTFSQAYKLPCYSPSDVETVWKSLSADRATQDLYRGLYNVGRGELDVAVFPAYRCAIGNLTRASFTACFCGERR